MVNSLTLDLSVPLKEVERFHLQTGLTLTISAVQADGAAVLERGRRLRAEFSPAEDGRDGMSIKAVDPIYRSMVDAYLAKVSCPEILDHENVCMFPDAGPSWAAIERVWPTEYFSKEYLLDNGMKTTLRELFSEVVYRANPSWDPFREEGGTTTRRLRSYAGGN
jgi:hypothetical protein